MRNIIPFIQWLIQTLKHALSHRCQQMTDMDRHFSLVEKTIKTYINIKLPSTGVGSKQCKININLGTSVISTTANYEHCGPELRMWQSWLDIHHMRSNIASGGWCMWPTFNPHPRDSVIRLLLTLSGSTRWVRAVVPHGCVWMRPDCGDLLTAVHATNAQLLVNDKDERVTVWLEQRLSWIVSHNS